MYQNYGQDNSILLRRLEKRRNIYTIIFVVMFLLFSVTGWISQALSGIFFVLMGLSAGFGLLAINYYRYNKSGGRKKGGGLWWILLFLFGGIIVPVLTVVVANKITSLAEVVLGIKIEG